MLEKVEQVLDRNDLSYKTVGNSLHLKLARAGGKVTIKYDYSTNSYLYSCNEYLLSFSSLIFLFYLSTRYISLINKCGLAMLLGACLQQQCLTYSK